MRKTDRVGEGVLGRGVLACGCVPLYPLFIHSLLSQSLGNETGDGSEDLRGGSSLTPFIFFCSFHLSLSICSSPPRYLHLSMALDHFKMSGPSPQMAETEEKYHRSYLGLQTMNLNCCWDRELPRAGCVVCHSKKFPFQRIWMGGGVLCVIPRYIFIRGGRSTQKISNFLRK